MKSSGRNLSIVLIILFVIVTSYAAIQLQALPGAILQTFDLLEFTALEKAEQIAYRHYAPLAGALLLVILLIISIGWRKTGKAEDQIIYVEKENLKEEDRHYSAIEQEEKQLQARIDRFKYKSTQLQEEVPLKRLQALFSAICNELEASSGALYLVVEEDGLQFIEFTAGYAFEVPKSSKLRYELGEGLAGQVAKSGNELVTGNVPEGYIKVFSGLGESTPDNLAVFPIKTEENVKGVFEIAALREIKKTDIEYVRQVASILATEVLQETIKL